MSQPSSVNRDDFRDDDLLSSFDPEVRAIPQEVPVAAPAAIAAAAGSDGQSGAAALSAKLDEATHEIERSRGEVSALRAELATIVAKVRDIERKVARNREPFPAPHRVAAAAPERYRWLKAVALALLVVANAILWRPLPGSPKPDPVQPPTGLVQPIDEGPAPPISETRAQSIATPAVPFVAIAAPLAPLAPVATALVADPPPPPKRVAGVDAAQPAKPREFLGTLAVQTDPPGAAVFVNRQPAGETPLRLPAMRAGSHLLWIERDGYRRWTRVVTVPADQVTNVTARLERQ